MRAQISSNPRNSAPPEPRDLGRPCDRDPRSVTSPVFTRHYVPDLQSRANLSILQMNNPILDDLLAKKGILEGSLSSIEMWALVFGIVVVVGVAGESVFGVRAWWNNRKLQTVLESIDRERQSEIAAATQKAEEASERAANAEGNLANARERAALAEQHAAEANAKAEGFRLDIAKATERAADANRIAEEERLARLQLQSRLADRTLTPGQQNEIRSQLDTVPGVAVDVVIWGDTPEIQIISGLLLDSLPKSWTVHQGQAGGGGAAVRGILVGTRAGSDANSAHASALLVSALQAAGLAGGPWAFDQMPLPVMMFRSNVDGKAPVRIFIGAKP